MPVGHVVFLGARAKELQECNPSECPHLSEVGGKDLERWKRTSSGIEPEAPTEE